MSSEILSETAGVVDALPYIDLGYDEPGVREAVSKPEVNVKHSANNPFRYFRH